jgi:hypothetical protein
MLYNKHNFRIGFNDLLLTAVGIPFLSFIIPIVFMGCRFNSPPYFTWEKYLATLAITAVIWLGNRGVMTYSRKKYPLFSDVRRRIIFQSLLMLVFTLIANMTMGRLLENIFNEDKTFSLVDIIIHSNSAALFCTIMVIAVYESVFFMHQLRHSVEETENLKRESLKAQLDALRTQVNPHFLFNNLNTLCSIIPENPKQATEFVQQLSKVYRHILEVRDEKTIPLQDELEVLKAYAFLLQTRFGGNLEVDIDVPADKLQKKIVPLSLQILMENAIKHNIVSIDKPLKIEVFAKNGTLVVNNNLQKKNQISESTGIGLENIRNRYSLLGNKTVDVQEANGNFTVSIPLIEN